MAQPMGAPTSQEDCAAAAPLPPALAGWAEPSPLKAASDEQGLAQSNVVPGRAVELTLVPTPEVRYLIRPEQPGGSVSYGGLVRFVVDEAATYRVALETAAWIDVVRDGVAAASVAHGHGPDCSGIRKMVDFALEPGSYVLQIAANGVPSVRVLVTRAEQ
ncbi:MAG: hypothetical protein R3E09_00270 [Novosphingobium sp.]